MLGQKALPEPPAPKIKKKNAAYVRWELKDGSFVCKLIFAKCRIAPLDKVSTPQMELNAAVLSKRGRKVVESEMRYTFDKVLQIVDSETVLCQIHKISTRLIYTMVCNLEK